MLQRESLLRGAIEVWEEALVLEPNNLALLRDLAQYYLKLKDHENACRICKRIVRLAPDDAVARRNLAISYQNSKQYRKALRAWEKALEIDDKGPAAKTARRQIQTLKQILKSSFY